MSKPSDVAYTRYTRLTQQEQVALNALATFLNIYEGRDWSINNYGALDTHRTADTAYYHICQVYRKTLTRSPHTKLSENELLKLAEWYGL